MFKKIWLLLLILIFSGSLVLFAQANPFEDSPEIEPLGVPPEKIIAPQTFSDVQKLTVPTPVESDFEPNSLAIPRGFLIVGHMGAPMEEPDNTIEGFEKALELGANAIEIDLCISKDGYLVLWHDWDPENLIARFRQLGKQGLKYRPYCPNLLGKFRKPLPRLTLAEFRKNYGYTLRKNGLGTSKRAPYEIPTFEDFCKWASQKDSLEKFFLDIKIPKNKPSIVPGYFSQLIKLLDQYDLKGKAVCMIPYESILKKALPIAKENGLALSYDRELPPVLILRPSRFSSVKMSIESNLPFASIGRPVATILGYSIYKKIVASDMKEMKKHNQSKPGTPLEGLICWTIDKSKEMQDLIKLGVQGIVTNRPEVLKKVVDNKP